MSTVAAPRDRRAGSASDSDGPSWLADRRASTLFIHLAFIGALILQRFAVFVAGSPIFFALVIYLGLIAWMLLTGRGRIRPVILLLYVMFAIIGLISAFLAINHPDPRVGGISIPSMLLLYVLYIGLTIAPTSRFDGTRVFDIFVLYVRFFAVLGILQYLAQFIGIRWFSFMLMVPAMKPILVEPLYNFYPIVAYGSSIVRSNGFFLLEPSTFSQLLALGIAVDFFVRRDYRFLPLYALAYLFTYAGTGLLALAISTAIYALIEGRHLGRIAGLLAALLLLAGIGALAFPEQFGSLSGRANEVGYSGSSGNARYMTQFDIIAAITGETRTLIGYGPGALERASFFVEGGSNPALKLYVDYGLAGLIGFFTFFVCAIWRRDVAIVSLFSLVNFQLGGGNLLTPPLIVITSLLCIWPRAPLKLLVPPSATARS